MAAQGVIQRIPLRSGPDGDHVRPQQQRSKEKEGADPEKKLETGGNTVSGFRCCGRSSGCFFSTVFLTQGEDYVLVDLKRSAISLTRGGRQGCPERGGLHRIPGQLDNPTTRQPDHHFTSRIVVSPRLVMSVSRMRCSTHFRFLAMAPFRYRSTIRLAMGAAIVPP